MRNGYALDTYRKCIGSKTEKYDHNHYLFTFDLSFLSRKTWNLTSIFLNTWMSDRFQVAQIMESDVRSGKRVAPNSAVTWNRSHKLSEYAHKYCETYVLKRFWSSFVKILMWSIIISNFRAFFIGMRLTAHCHGVNIHLIIFCIYLSRCID